MRATVVESAYTTLTRQKILFASGYTSDVTILNGLLESGVALAHKPFTSESLGQKVREVLDGK